MADPRFVEAFENSFLFHPSQDIESLQVQHLEGFATSSLANSPFFETQKVSAIRLDGQTLESAYEFCSDYFRERGAGGFYWLVSELSTPADLGEKLQHLGASHGGGVWGMRLATDTQLAVSPLTGLVIKELDEAGEADPVYPGLIDEAYGALGSGMGESMMELTRQFRRAGNRIYTYIAYESEKPVAFSCLLVLEDGITALLCGSGTLAAYRGRGIYGNMLEVRRALAVELGCSQLLIQAKQQTSAPIALKHGFERCCTGAIYTTMF
ncbi:hypothetical protein E2F43_07005 [Seongchinamella unica]|uniref:N-acetyltransferase domain-containing protein n=1 Tax=Seongchinamella unica TaxID=2547392 RepID=A0A4R5LXF0_9GAMM|nr:GNAT family N-acetyltransferase [Seongchinamella unica]TDG15968.1 hypothetical protein E2F43_07005 [Seongchinamella unica]